MDDKHHHSVAKYDPTINLGSILQALIFVIAVAGAYTATQVQINSNRKDIESLKITDQHAKEELTRFKDQVREDIRDMRSEVQDVNANVLKVLSKLPNE
ncbi:hypothetical protein GCM10023116_46660 [Kistimonas scapharcae]|uniref:Uncharacterized protein n=1 Tax=Kistimonas scapharcae TaxID=1036133 RepID=A0ABP8VBP3_9GAMM